MEFILTDKHPWSGSYPEAAGPRRSGVETVTTRCLMTGVTDTQLSYRILKVLAVEDPLPGGPYDGDQWQTRTERVSGNDGGMTMHYFGELLQAGRVRLCLDARDVVARAGGYEFTDDDLHRYFDMVRNRSHWKNPIRRCATLPSERDVYGMHEAVVYIAGCVPEVECINPETHKYRVTAIGYFMAVGS
jgi:hypothetical protein